jgi:hypothetical protein
MFSGLSTPWPEPIGLPAGMTDAAPADLMRTADLLFLPLHDVAPDATAWSARNATWSMVIAGIDPDPQQADALKAWGRAYWQAVHPYNLEGAYVNFMMDDETEGRLQATYGENYNRLALVKAKYDPENLFRVNQNIEPAKAVRAGM